MIFKVFDGINRKYKVIYADPPWKYGDKLNHSGGGAESHYPTMETEEIMALPVNSISEDDCILLIWVTFPTLLDGMRVIEAWGFKYKTLGFSWIKLNKGDKRPFFGIGHYTKSNCEVCLIGVKGKPQIVNNDVSSCVISVKEEHSRKPEEVFERIDRMCGDVPKIELFARIEYEGWDQFGNQVGKFQRKLQSCLTDF